MVGSQPMKISTGTMSFDPIPEDKYQIQVMDVMAIEGTKFNSSEPDEKLRYEFVILDPEKTMETADAGTVNLRGRKLWARFSKTLSTPDNKKPSNLTKFVTAVYGKALEEAELKVWEPEDVIGKQLCVMVNQTPGTKDDTIFNNCISFSKAPKQMEAFTDTKEKKAPVVKKSQAIDASDFEKMMDEEKSKGQIK